MVSALGGIPADSFDDELGDELEESGDDGRGGGRCDERRGQDLHVVLSTTSNRRQLSVFLIFLHFFMRYCLLLSHASHTSV